jgi:MFS family permease
VGQLSEVLFMAAMPFFIVRLGVKNMLAIGMLAWVARYFLFGTLAFPLIVVGLILHGVCYDFFFVASQIYVDSRVSGEQRARAQSFIAFVTFGLGMFVGSYVGGIVVDTYPPLVQVPVTVSSADGKSDTKPQTLPAWDASGKSGFASALGLKPEATLALDQLPEELVDEAADKSSKTVVTKADLEKVFAAIDTDGNKQVSRAEWVVARQRQWPMIWLCPALMAAVTCALFWVGFKNPEKLATPVAE